MTGNDAGLKPLFPVIFDLKPILVQTLKKWPEVNCKK